MTKAQRHQFYKDMMKAACEDTNVHYGFCTLIRNMGWFYMELKDLRELYKMKPKKENLVNFVYWFHTTTDGWRKRLELLQKCIELTK